MAGPSGLNYKNLLEEVYEKARKKQWIAAAQLCGKVALGNLGFPPAELASLTEFYGTCHFKSAFQAKTSKDFEKLMGMAGDAYEKARALHADANQFARLMRVEAETQLATFWLQPNPSSRMEIAVSVANLFKEASEAFAKAGEETEEVETKLGLFGFFREFINLATDFESLIGLFNETLEVGRSTVGQLRKQSEGEGLVEALNHMVWLLAVEAQIVKSPLEFQSLFKEIQAYQDELETAARKLGSPHALCLAKESAGHVAFDVDGDPSRALEEYEASLDAATDLEDKLQIGRLQWLISQAANWLAHSESDSGKRRALLQKGTSFASLAIENLKIPFQTNELTAAHATCATCHIELAELAKVDLAEKRIQLQKAIDVASQGTTYESGTLAWSLVAHAQARALSLLSSLEEPAQSLKLLREALRIREETVEVTDRLFPHFWTHILMRYHLALTQSELAVLEEDSEVRDKLLSQSISEMGSCLERGAKWATNPGFVYRLGQYGESYGRILFQSYSTTKEPLQAHKAIEAYETATEQFASSKHNAEAASLKWKIARIYDLLGEFNGASEAFTQAAKSYGLVGAELPFLKATFEELVQYMEAWTAIEKARQLHSEEEYHEASERYLDAASILEMTKTWNYLSRLCTARSLLEKGEALSQEEKHTAATESIRAALDRFREAKTELSAKLRDSVSEREKQELEESLKTSEQRETYSRGRLELEEARILDKRGEKSASSRKYLSAGSTFKMLGSQVEAHDQGEIETLALFCEAWARMKQAESESSPQLFAEAAQIFSKARARTTREALSILALANASICGALEAGTRFRVTRDARLYSEIKRQLETAADYYQEAGFRKTGAWTRATKRLFDALFYLSDAESERDAKKKTELYHMAEKTLELAAKLYGEAGFPTKKREALEHLEQAREEKELLIHALSTLSEIPTATGASLTSASLKGAQPMGLERFEEANLVGHLTVPEREVKTGSDFIFEVEIANVGRTTATLIKLEDVIPEGFEIEREKNPYRIEGNSIDMRGKRLEHLKMEEMRIVLRPVRKGVFRLRPRAVFADDRGNVHRFEFEPVEVVVEELGIGGWLKGPSKKEETKPGPVTTGEVSKTLLLSKLEGIQPLVHLPPEFQFETERAREVFERLVKEFLHDYMSKRLYIDAAGWRTLMDLVEQTKIPRSSLYGPEGRDGPVLAELERRGLIETRIFPKERGRGGDIKKIRVAYGNEVVRTIVDRTAMRNP